MALLILISAADADGAGYQRRDVPQNPAASHEDTPSPESLPTSPDTDLPPASSPPE
jgi:hypothetical protein